jgi:hypothetical protein
MAIATSINDILGADVSRLDTTRQHRLGQIGRGVNGAEWEYVQFNSSSIVAGHMVAIDKDYLATTLTTAASPRGTRCGVVMAATASSGTFGWVQRQGQVSLRVLANAAANARLNTTATAGILDDDGTAGAKHIEGVALQVANGGATANQEATLNGPIVGVTI